jgi:hypothetical protein
MQVAAIGLDLAKHVFQIHGIDAAESPLVWCRRWPFRQRYWAR